MKRTRGYYREQRRKHIKRKQRMVKEWSLNGNCIYWVAPAGALSKGKIHCSCWMCRKKSYDHKAAKDSAKIEAMNQSEKYYYDNYGYCIEESEDELINDDFYWYHLQIDNGWYYEQSYYYDWLDEHPNGSTDYNGD